MFSLFGNYIISFGSFISFVGLLVFFYVIYQIFEGYDDFEDWLDCRWVAIKQIDYVHKIIVK